MLSALLIVLMVLLGVACLVKMGLVLGNRNAFMTFVEPGHAKAIMFLGGLWRMVGTPSDARRSGLKFVGIPGLFSVKCIPWEILKVTGEGTDNEESTIVTEMRDYISLRDGTIDFTTGILRTKDPITVRVPITIHYRIKGDTFEEKLDNARKALFEVEKVISSFRDEIEIHLRPLIGSHTFEKLLSIQTQIFSESENHGELLKKLREVAGKWGIEIETIGMEDVKPIDPEMEKALAQKLIAKKKREAVQEEAKGEKYRIESVYEAIMKNGGIEVKKYETIAELAKSSNKMLVSLPELAQILGGFTKAKDLATMLMSTGLSKDKAEKIAKMVDAEDTTETKKEEKPQKPS